ncbi:polysaccharide biosynthesis protein [Bacteroides coprosuis DSM 18011]|uniref:Polysaccharide biosynthesis protein n=1 Tax=Bacteroides coprosuis DSM 18011 TaxID=679937 RepID=F3ZQQ4_9BACE|nr:MULTISPECIES: lipopolysaccharide biosynthesis protein [Bacteroides]EGJ70562.1 polysaccharide biosynthesis protein [Bacteroides coprosuis DSM 18011]
MTNQSKLGVPKNDGKKLVKDIMIYGVSSIVGRFLNYLLVPLYSYKMPVESGSYGVVSNMYALIALLLVILTYGMETGFFYYANKQKENPKKVFSTILIAVGVTSLVFVLLCLLNLDSIAHLLEYDAHPEYLGMMMVVVAMDAFMSILFAYLRYKNRPIKFAGIKLFFIGCNIILNLFFLVWVPYLQPLAPDLFTWYDPQYLERYVFVANLIATSMQLLFFIPELKGMEYIFDKALFKRIFKYSFPVLILGVAGVLSQTFDKIIFPLVYPDADKGYVELGIYGATSKIAMIMGMCTQAFRYAYEPFVFSKNKEGDGRQTYAEVMKFFLIFTLLGFLGVVFYMDIIRYIIQPGYWEGLRVVPIVMVTEILIGVFFNLAYWYKLIEQTKWGAYFSIIGCVIIIVLNLLWIPKYSYMGCAWAGVVGYGVMTLLSYIVGQKKNPIPYNLKEIGIYIGLAFVLYLLGTQIEIENFYLRMLYRTILILLYVTYVVKKDLPLARIPIINRFIKK